MCGCGGYNYSKSKCGQAGATSTCGQVPKTTSSCVPAQRASTYQQAPKSTPMNADKTGTNQELKATAQSAAAEHLSVEEEKQKEKEFAMSR